MGSSSSKVEQYFTSTTESISNTLISNATECNQNNSAAQSLRVKAGSGSTITITNTSLSTMIDSRVACLMTTTLTDQDIANIKADIESNLKARFENLPTLQTKSKNSSKIVQNWSSYVTNNIDLNNILKNVQNSATEQTVDIETGDQSVVLIDNFNMTSVIKMVLEATQTQVQSLANSFTQDLVVTGDITSEEANGATEAVTAISGDLADVANNAITTGGDVAKTSITSTANVIMMAIVALVIGFIVLIMNGGNLPKMLLEKTPLGMAIKYGKMFMYEKDPNCGNDTEPEDNEDKPAPECKKIAMRFWIAMAVVVAIIAALLVYFNLD